MSLHPRFIIEDGTIGYDRGRYREFRDPVLGILEECHRPYESIWMQGGRTTVGKSLIEWLGPQPPLYLTPKAVIPQLQAKRSDV